MAKSIIQSDRSYCFLCGRNGNGDRLEEHHIFFGIANKKIADKHGLTVYLCGNRCHRLGEKSVHKNAVICRKLQAYAQKKAMKYYNWTIDDFRSFYGKSYI